MARIDGAEAAHAAEANTAVLASVTTPGVAQVARQADGHYWAEADINGRAVRGLVDTGATVQRGVEGARLSVAARSAQDANEAMAALLAAGIEPVDFALGSPSLDEVFFALTGRAGEPAAPGESV